MTTSRFRNGTHAASRNAEDATQPLDDGNGRDYFGITKRYMPAR